MNIEETALLTCHHRRKTKNTQENSVWIKQQGTLLCINYERRKTFLDSMENLMISQNIREDEINEAETKHRKTFITKKKDVLDIKICRAAKQKESKIFLMKQI